MITLGLIIILMIIIIIIIKSLFTEGNMCRHIKNTVKNFY